MSCFSVLPHFGLLVCCGALVGGILPRFISLRRFLFRKCVARENRQSRAQATSSSPSALAACHWLTLS